MENPLSPEQQAQFVTEVLTEWAEALDEELRKQLREKTGHVPEETISNLRYRLVQDTEALGVAYQLSFQDSGRHVDMRRLDFEKNPIQKGNNFILEWAKKKGRAAFKRQVPGYKYKGRKKSGLTEAEELERIANAIIFAKGSQNPKPRRRRKKQAWTYNKTVYGFIERLTSTLIKEQAAFLKKAISKDIAENVKMTLNL